MTKPSKLLSDTIQFLAQRGRGLIQDSAGQTMVEYVMLIVLVALAVFLIAPNIKSAILNVFSNTSSALQ
jgi:Flp pilus assembly pilin Flp